ncbi:MAG: bifunctional UDP-N-acetylmuramoyl-tripeptide:D-alanyl-D-alanine ligase/alanine racemase [Bacteroidetes bacterium]|nr:bifunctional UDP-N-acetylmuramoyl-tripeptide:D-alanyl-D-alanine ligase/alanine racemase [Bacteroidota bacterium]
MEYSINDIAKILLPDSSLRFSDVKISAILIDSRQLINPAETLFFAIEGDRNDGHTFIPSLIDLGVRNFVVRKVPDNYSGVACNFICVQNTLTALQKLAGTHRAKFNFPLIGITGSNGKTIVKEWIYQLLKEDKHIVRSPKSYNSQVGVPLSLWQITEEHELGIFEAGISKPNEMKNLEAIVKPSIGIFTNIGQAHAENFDSLEQKIEEKILLFENAEILIYCRDYAAIHEAIVKNEHFSNANIFSWSKKSKANLQIGRISKKLHETDIQGIYNNNFISITIPFIDDASIENAIHCWALLLYLKYDNALIANRIKHLAPVAMRLELKEGINDCSIINDSYNSDIGSLAIALDFLNQQKQYAKRTVVLSDILQTGKSESALYKEVADLIHQKGVTRIIGIGPSISKQFDVFKIEKYFFQTTQEFIQKFPLNTFYKETILLKGARAFGFEQISKMLQQKAHETVLEINLNALIHNLNFYKSKIQKGTKLMAMVKASSYGSGSFEIANTLQHNGVDYLAVAYADEGIELRKAGITLPLMVMNPEEQSYNAMIEYKLEPEIFSFRVLNLFEDAIKKYHFETGGSTSQHPVHIKLDTGMHRLGFEEKELNELIVRLKNNKSLVVKSVFSHLAASDDSRFDDFTRMQIKKLQELAAQIEKHFSYSFDKHILNSSGISRFPDAQFNMVRLGIGLYGIPQTDEEKKFLTNVSSLKTTISQIKTIAKGDSVGYGRSFIAEKEMKTATIPIGYADGLSRKLSNGVGRVYINHKPAPIVGRVCMDMTMVDVTDIAANEGDEVIIFDGKNSILELAQQMDTIPYEVLTSISARVKRIYFQE